jgi:hypothetical protein
MGDEIVLRIRIDPYPLGFDPKEPEMPPSSKKKKNEFYEERCLSVCRLQLIMF